MRNSEAFSESHLFAAKTAAAAAAAAAAPEDLENEGLNEFRFFQLSKFNTDVGRQMRSAQKKDDDDNNDDNDDINDVNNEDCKAAATIENIDLNLRTS